MKHKNHVDMDQFWCCGGSIDAEECSQMWRERIHHAFGSGPGEHWFFGARRFRDWLAAGGPVHMNPFVAPVLSKGAGLLPLFVLHLLSREPRYGNDIMRELEGSSGGAWSSNPGAMYPLLRMLEHHGLLRGEWEDPDKRTRRIYHLTEQGRHEYRELKDMMRPGLQAALGVLRALYHELYEEELPVDAGLSTAE